jgi:N-acyl-D-amino-acid deacylase
MWSERLGASASLLALVAAACGPRPDGPAGTVITNVVLYDGTGTAGRPGALRIVADTIAAVGEVTPSRRDSVVDGRGLALAPGFVDTHSHHDRGLLQNPTALAAVSQGITTIVAGQDGGQHYPLASWLDSLGATPPAVNVASYAGHNTLRRLVLGSEFRRVATAPEIDSMAALLRVELGAGALGLSTGLEYDPGIYSDRAEVLALARVAADSGGRYISHIRSEDRWFWDAIDEILTIGREARLPVQVSHLKLAMTSLWGRADSLIRILDRARQAGIDVTADVYPYTYWQSTLTVLFPKRDFRNRREAERVLREIAPADGLLLGAFDAEPGLAGTTVAEIARARGTDPATTLMALIAESQAWARSHGGDAGETVVATSMSEADVAALLAWEHANVSSDGALDGAHPRGFGTYPRVLGRYVREQSRMPLETAIARMTGRAARHVGIARRGELRAGWYADLVLFEPATVIDRATTTDPHAISAGIGRVWVNGREVFAEGRTTGAQPGRVVRRWDR